MDKLTKAFVGQGMSEEGARLTASSLKDEVRRKLEEGDIEDDDTLDELECIFACYGLEMGWLWEVNWSK